MIKIYGDMVDHLKNKIFYLNGLPLIIFSLNGLKKIDFIKQIWFKCLNFVIHIKKFVDKFWVTIEISQNSTNSIIASFQLLDGIEEL